MRTEYVSDMYIENIKAVNFKSFNNLDVTLNRLNVIIGANASGKTSFIQMINFLKDITVHGLDNAISRQGGLDYLVNLKQSNNALWFEVTLGTNRPIPLRTFTKRQLLKITKIVYSFKINLKKTSGYKIDTDRLDLNVSYNEPENETDLKYGKITIEKATPKKRIVDIQFPKPAEIKLHPYITQFIRNSEGKLILEDPVIIHHAIRTIGEFFGDVNVYDFDPKNAKHSSPIIGMAELTQDGSNLAMVLNDVLKQKDAKQTFFNLLNSYLPFIDSVDTETIFKSITATFKEHYYKRRPLPATLISDGTIDMTAIILALYFEQNAVTVFEEPERNIHPALMLKLTDMLDDASTISQIIITTHNPELLRHIDLDNVFMVMRAKSGDSKIIKPAESNEVKSFLADDIGIEHLYVQDLLGD